MLIVLPRRAKTDNEDVDTVKADAVRHINMLTTAVMKRRIVLVLVVETREVAMLLEGVDRFIVVDQDVVRGTVPVYWEVSVSQRRCCFCRC